MNKKHITNTLRKGIAVLLSGLLILQSFQVSAGETKNPSPQITLKPKYDVSEIIIKYKPGSDKEKIKTEFKQKSGISIKSAKTNIKLKDNEIIDVTSADNMQKALDSLNDISGIIYASPNYKIKSYSYTDEEMFAEQWGLQNIAQTVNSKTGTLGADIKAVPAWELATGEGITIGVLDTGIDIQNTDLAANIYTNTNEIPDNGIDDDNNGYIDDVNGWDFIHNDSGVYDSAEADTHGTTVAGIIAAAANTTGFVGVAPKAKILPLKFISGDTGTTADAMEAIEYAKVMGVKIINCSWGSDEYNVALKDTMQNSDILFVCAAGNKDEEQTSNMSYPAAFGLLNVISVGACDSDGNIASFTRTGDVNDIYAPGKNIPVNLPGNSYGYKDGTSLAAAYVSGIAALVREKVPNISSELLAMAIKNSAQNFGVDKTRLAGAQGAIKYSLPLNFIKDKDPRISHIMALINNIITSDIAVIFTKYTDWSQLDTENKESLTIFFGVKENDMTTCAQSELDLVDSLNVLLTAKNAEISTQTAIELFNSTAKTFNNELAGYILLKGKIILSNKEKSEILTLMLSGVKISDIISALIISQITQLKLSDIILTQDTQIDYDTGAYTGTEKDSLLQLVQKYHVDMSKIITYLNKKYVLPSELVKLAFAWQQQNNYYFTDVTVAPYLLSNLANPDFGKYKVPSGNAWLSGSAAVDKTDGMLTYGMSLFGMSVRGNLGFDIGLRFDPEVSDAVINANDPALLAYTVRVTDSREYYIYSGGSWGRDANSDEVVTTYINESEINQYEGYDDVEVIDDDVKYIRHIQITAGVDEENCDLEASGLANYYNATYNMGIGWALDLPSVEMIGESQFLHLPGGAKYTINADYSIAGYKLNDMTFDDATGTDFTANSVEAAYCLWTKDENKNYFDEDGRYIGSKDVFGNRIETHYNVDGTIAKIYDPANRYVRFSYATVDSDTKTVTLDLVDNTGTPPTEKLLYVLTLDKDANTQQYYLSSAADITGSTTSFTYGGYSSSVIFNDTSDIMSAAEISNSSIYLSQVTNPVGGVTNFTYTTAWKSYGYASDRMYKRISNISEVNGATTVNSQDFDFYKRLSNVNYAVDNNYWMYEAYGIYPYISTANTGLSTCISGDVKETFSYDLDCYELDTSSYDIADAGNVPLYSNTIASRDSQTGLPTQIVSRTYNIEESNTYTVAEENYTWDEAGYGNLLTIESYSGDQTGAHQSLDGKSEYTYGTSKIIPATLTQYTFYDTSNYLQGGTDHTYASRITNTFDATTKQVLTITKEQHDMTSNPTLVKTLSEEEFDYDSYGNMTSDELTYASTSADLDVSNQKVLLKGFTYENQYHTYLGTSTVYGVLNADGNAVNNSAGNITITTQFDMLGRITSYTDPNGNTTEYSYSESSNTRVETVTYPDDSTSTTTIDYAANATITINPDGTGSKTEYDDLGNLIHTYRRNSNLTSYDMLTAITYDDLNRVLTQVEYLNAAGTVYNTTTYEYDSVGRVVSTIVTDQESAVIGKATQSYDQAVTQNNTILNETTTNVYTSSNTDIQTSRYSDALGRTRISAVYNDPNIYTDNYTYLKYGRADLASGDTILYRQSNYDGSGRETNVCMGDNSYENPDDPEDPFLISIDNFSNYDGTDNMTDLQDAMGSNSIITYDILGRVIKEETPFQTIGATTYNTIRKTYYDDGGRITETHQTNNAVGVTAVFDNITIYTYDDMNRLVKTELVIDSTHSQFTQNYYDTDGRLIKVFTGLNDDLDIDEDGDPEEYPVDANYSVTEYEYDFYGRMTKYIDGTANDTDYTYYDLTGQLNTKTLGNGNVFTYYYYNTGNINYVEGTKSATDTIRHSYTYDLVGNVLTAEEKNITDDVTINLLTYTYDDAGNRDSVSYTLDEIEYLIEYTYYGNRQVDTSKIYIDDVLQSQKDYSYVNTYRLSNITYTGQSEDPVNLSYYYDENGNMLRSNVSTGQFNQVMQYYEYNHANLPTSVISTTWAEEVIYIPTEQHVSNHNKYFTAQNLSYKVDGNLASETNELRAFVDIDDPDDDYTVVSDDMTTYTYDNINRMIEESYEENNPMWSRAYTFDDYNNIDTLVYDDKINNNNDTTTTYDYDLANKITEQFIDGDTDHDYTFTYDNAGNIITKEEDPATLMTYTYDSLNRMVSSQPYGGTETSYVYNAADERISKTTGTLTTNSIWENGQIAFDVFIAGGYDYYKQFLQGNRQHGLIYDGALTPNFININGDAVAKITAFDLTTNNMSTGHYEAYGNALETANGINPYGYRGYYTDFETEFCYLNARYYDPSIQRFTQEDTYWNDNPQMNLYGYCSGNPVMYSDPSGHTIKLSSEATREEKKQYWRAIAYLQSSTEGNKLINKLKNAKEVITITFVSREPDLYTEYTNVIQWNVLRGLVLGDGKSILSPALCLAHEMGHAAQDLDGEYVPYIRSEISEYQLEQANLKKYEIPIAKQLGEFTRKNYFDASSLYIVNSSTDWGALKTIHPWWHYIGPWNWGKSSKTFENLNPWTPYHRWSKYTTQTR